MNAANKGLKFGSFEDLNPEDHRLIVSFLTSGSQRVKLYWERPVNKFNFKSSHASTATQTQDVKFVKPDSGGGDGGDSLAETGPKTETPAPSQQTPSGAAPAQPSTHGGPPGPVQAQPFVQGGPGGPVQAHPSTLGGPTGPVQAHPSTHGGPTGPVQAHHSTHGGPTGPVQAQPSTHGGPTGPVQAHPSTQGGPTGSVQAQPSVQGGPTGPPPPTQDKPQGGEGNVFQQAIVPNDQSAAAPQNKPMLGRPYSPQVSPSEVLGSSPHSVHGDNSLAPRVDAPQINPGGPPGIRTDPGPPAPHVMGGGQQEGFRPGNQKFESGPPRGVPDAVTGAPDNRESGPRQYQSPQLPPHHIEGANTQAPGPIFDNYFPPPPPNTDFVPQPMQQGGMPQGNMQNKVMPQGRPPHMDLGYGMQPRWSENEPVRGHVEDGVYTRPGQNAPATTTSTKTYERRNKKRRPPDYYKRYDSPVDPNQGAQNMGGMVSYPQMSSVRPSLEAPSSGSYVGIPGSGSVITSQYGQQLPVSAYTMLNTNLMTPLHPTHAVLHMQLLQQQQQAHQQAHQQAQRQAVASSQQQQFLAQLNAPAYPYLQHAAASPMFQQAANSLRPAGLGQSPPGRPMTLSPVGLTPSHGAMTAALGRSPPRTSPMAVPQYPESQHHGYHAQQASPTVPPMTQVSQGPLQAQVVNTNNTYNPTSANQVHKEVPRTGGRPLIGAPPAHVAAHPAAMSTFMGPPLHQQPAVVPKVPHAMPVHRLGSPQQGPPPLHQGPPQPQINPQVVQAEPKPTAPTPTESEPPPVLQPVDNQVAGPPPGVVVKCSPAPAQAPAPPSPQSEKLTKPDPTSNEENKGVTKVDTKAMSSDAGVNKTAAAPDGPVDKIAEASSEKKMEDRPAPKFFTLTFGTVQDIETMKAQPVPKDIEQNEVAPEAPAEDLGRAELATQSKLAPKPEVVASLVAPTGPPVGSVTPSTPQPQAVEPPKEQPKAENVPRERPVATVHPQPVVEPNDTSASQSRPSASAAKPNEGAVTTAKPNEGANNTPKPVEVATPKPAEVPNVWGSSSKTWASLFGSKQSPGSESPATPVANNHQAGGTRKSEDKDDAKDLKKPVTTADDNRAKALGEFLLNYTVKYTQVSLQPRGLYNRSNWCYINATLQALLACPALYQLLKALPYYKGSARGPSSTPVIDCMVQFVNEFNEIEPQKLKYIEKSTGKGPQRSNVDIRYGAPFEPVNILQMLQVIQYNTSFKHGRQEDAEEFMSCILNALHDEMVACMNAARADHPATGEEKARENGDLRGDSGDGSTASKEEDEDQWEQVGPKNKSVVTRSQAKLKQSPISEVFGGQLRSIFHQQGQKESATLQPFFTLQLDLQHEKVWTVMDALEVQASKETIHGYTDSTTKQEVEAYRRLMIDELPPVLILHLKCFIYLKTGGAQKLTKQIDFSTDLTIAKELMSPNARSKYPPAKRNYELFSVVNHHGSRVVGGHYTADVLHPGLHTWVRLDDSSVRVVTSEKVTQFEPPRFPYLLYFRRKDLN